MLETFGLRLNTVSVPIWILFGRKDQRVWKTSQMSEYSHLLYISYFTFLQNGTMFSTVEHYLKVSELQSVVCVDAAGAGTAPSAETQLLPTASVSLVGWKYSELRFCLKVIISSGTEASTKGISCNLAW